MHSDTAITAPWTAPGWPTAGRLKGAFAWVAQMGRRQARILILGCLVLAAALAVRVVDPGLLSLARFAAFDQYQRLAPRPFTPLPIRVIDIDDETLSRLGQWPWPRDQVAGLIDRLDHFGVWSIALDIIFAEADRTSPSRLAQRLGNQPGQAIVQQALRQLPDHDVLLAEAFAHAPVVTGFALASKANATRPSSKAGMATIGDASFALGDRFPGAIANLPQLEAAAAGNGSLSIVAERDEVVRRVPVLQRLEGVIVPSLAVEALRVAQGATTLKVRFDDQGGSLRVGQIDIPFDRDGKYGVHYRKDVADQSIPAWQVFDAAATPALQPLLADTIVFIGTSAAGLKDLRSTPLSAFTPGVFIHAQALEQMLSGKPLTRPVWLTGLEIIVVAVAATLLLIAFASLPARWSAILALAAVAATVTASWLAFTHRGLLVDPVWPSVTVIVLYLAVISMTYARAERERGQIRHAFGRYMAPALVDTLVKHPERLRLSGEIREMTFLFSDIANFTPFVERTPPDQLIELLNAYLDQIRGVVMEHGGTLDKIVGDAIHAIFNAPLDQADHAEQAVRCALAMDRCSRRFVDQCRDRGISFGHTRIGINTGNAVIGNFGGESRFDYTAHGDAVNLAARLEGTNKWIGSRICVAATAAASCHEIAFRPLGELLVVGRTETVATFEPLPQAEAEGSWFAEYCEAYRLMADERVEAATLFEALAHRFPDDAVIAFHARRLAAGDRGTRIKMSNK